MKHSPTAFLLPLLCLTTHALAQDRFEVNDTVGQETPLDLTVSDVYETGLSVHQIDDIDRFLISVPEASGFPQIEVIIEFSHASGDLDLKVFSESYSQIGVSNSVTDNESMVITNTSDPIIVWVESYGNAIQADYTLWIRAYDAAGNNSLPTATYLGTFADNASFAMSGSLHNGQTDWYRFDVAWEGEVVRYTTKSSSPLDTSHLWTHIYDASGTKLSKYTTIFEPGTYYLQFEANEPAEWTRYAHTMEMRTYPVTNLSPIGGPGSLHKAIVWANSYEGSVDPVIDLTSFPCQSLVLDTPLPDVTGRQGWELPPNDPFGLVQAPGSPEAMPTVTGQLSAIMISGHGIVGSWHNADEPNDDLATRTNLTLDPVNSLSTYNSGYSIAPKGDVDWYLISGYSGGEVRLNIFHDACLGRINTFASFAPSGTEVYTYSWDTGDVEEHTFPMNANFCIHGKTEFELSNLLDTGSNPRYQFTLEYYDRFEPNDTHTSPPGIPPAIFAESRTEGMTLATGDTDWYRFATERGSVEVAVEIPPPGKPVNAILRVYRETNSSNPPVLIEEDTDPSDGLSVLVNSRYTTDLLIELVGTGPGGIQLGEGFFYDLVTRFTAVPQVLHVTNLDGAPSEGSLHTVLEEAMQIHEDFDIGILFPDLSGVIQLEEPLPVITRAVGMAGSDAGCMVIDGQGAFRLFQVENDVELQLSHLTLRNGYADDGQGGGGVLCISGGLSLFRVILENCQSSGPGGGLNADFLEVQESIVRHCRAPAGGGIASGYFTVSRSAIYANEAYAGDGGGLLMKGGANSACDLRQSTFSENVASGRGGAVFLWEPDVNFTRLLHLTVTGNAASEGGGVYTAEAEAAPLGLYIENNIIVGNTADTDPELSPYLVNHLPATFTNMFAGDPHLAPLDYYGGFTPCHALWPDSPAIDAGDPGPPSFGFDQRGVFYQRVVNGRADLGSFESGHDPKTYALWSIYALRKLKTEPDAAPGDDFNGDGVSNLLHYAYFRDGNVPFWQEPIVESVTSNATGLSCSVSLAYREGEDLFFSYWCSFDLIDVYYFAFHCHESWRHCSDPPVPFTGSAITPETLNSTHNSRPDGAKIHSLTAEFANQDSLFFFKQVDLRERSP